MRHALSVWAAAAAAAAAALPHQPPNLVFIVADDLGWSDVSYNGGEVPTPNIDALARQGVALNNYYVQPVCTPTRAAFMTGLFPIHNGMQNNVIQPARPYGLPSNLTTIADQLRGLGYSTIGIGKWHLGFCHSKYLPTNRGFESWYGFLNGAEGYFSHKLDAVYDRSTSFSNFSAGYDFRSGKNESIDRKATGVYSTNDFANQAVAIIREHPESKPLYLYLAFQAVHGPYEAPDAYVDLMNKHSCRGTYAGMLYALDQAIGNVSSAISGKSQQFSDNTLVILSSDNGGLSDRFGKGASNYPLKGQKATIFEGGTRVVGIVHGRLLARTGYQSNQMVHAVDWFTTMLRVATNGSWHSSVIGYETDSLDVWDAISRNASSPRTDFVYNIGTGGEAYRMGDYKYIVAHGHPKRWDHRPLVKFVNGSCEKHPPPSWRPHDDDSLLGDVYDDDASTPYTPQLFNLRADPREMHDLSKSKSAANIIQKMQALQDAYQASAVPALYDIYDDDYRADPAFHDGVWDSWGCQAP